MTSYLSFRSIRTAAVLFVAFAAIGLMSQSANAQGCGYGGGYGGGFGGGGISVGFSSFGSPYRGGFNSFNRGGFNNFNRGGFSSFGRYNSFRPVYGRRY